MIDSQEIKSDQARVFQLLALAATAVAGLLSALIEGTFFTFLWLLMSSALALLCLAPPLLGVLKAGKLSVGQTGGVVMRSVEGAGIAGLGAVVNGVMISFAILFGHPGSAMGGQFVNSVLMVQVIANGAIAAGVGLVGFLRHSGVAIEVPKVEVPASRPAVPAQAAPAAAPAQQQWTPEQWAAYQQQQQQYQQQQYQQPGQAGYGPPPGAPPGGQRGPGQS